MDLVVKPPDIVLWGTQRFRCALGRGGAVAATLKREGDGATPVGRWNMRQVFYRADREVRPVTRLPVRVLNPEDGWCDAPGDINYNKFVEQPYPVSAEKLWRDDGIYDLIVVLGWNDAPVVMGRGSAIFLHVAPLDYGPSAGCVTLAREDLRRVLAEADLESCVEVTASAL